MSNYLEYMKRILIFWASYMGLALIVFGWFQAWRPESRGIFFVFGLLISFVIFAISYTEDDL